ncbi:MAG: VOC family protein [Kutzneria sp.]|nr:VOC family protein [Kutzneria sp.]MBV9845447.1 VOC family protein [Kutzneria sp.]
MNEKPTPTVWPTLRYDDASAALTFLTGVFGFREALVVRDDDGDIVHAELRWPEGGAVMFGTCKATDGPHAQMKAGVGAVYVVTEDVDGLHERVHGAAEIAGPLRDTDYGSRDFTVRDPEGNLWTFGDYRGAP